MKNIIWCSAYPKSGNTWLRILLDSILYRDGGLVSINNLAINRSSSVQRQAFNAYFGIESSDLTVEETWVYKREYLHYFFGSIKERSFVKTHDANVTLPNLTRLFPKEITNCCVHVVRNPLDIVSSLANHLGISVDQSIEQMNNYNFYSYELESQLKCTAQLYSKSLSWSDHVESWLNTTEYPVHLIRFEDLVNNPLKILQELMMCLNEDRKIPLIRKAVQNNSFEELSRQEKHEGFAEKSPLSTSFFRKGKVGGWKQELNDKQVERVIADHKIMMQKLGYLP